MKINCFFTFYVISTCLVVLMAKKHRKGIKREHEDSREDTFHGIDLRGNLSKTFFLIIISRTFENIMRNFRASKEIIVRIHFLHLPSGFKDTPGALQGCSPQRNRVHRRDATFSISILIKYSAQPSWVVEHCLKFCGHPGVNSVCSPLSALMPLGKLALGAEGQALDELVAAIGVTKKSKIQNRFKPLIAHLRYLPGGKLDIANRLYVSKKTHLHRPFLEQARDIFASGVTKIDFQYPTFAAEEINSWVSSQTNYMIKDILEPSDISPSTSLVVVNAVYFNGRWREPFEKISNKTFYSPMGGITVPMMSTSSYYNYTASEILSAKIIEIPYHGEKASFIIVLPTSRQGLSTLLSQLKLAPELLDLAMANMALTRIDLTIPKFRIESKLNLKKLYEEAGVKQIFNSTDSGLDKITRDGSLYVTSAKQKAYIDVHQFGSEAGAASSSTMMKLSFQKPETFNADHPFLFFILVKKQQLFSGILSNPLLIK